MGGGAWPFLVGGVICLVNSVNERDLSLLNSYANLAIHGGGGPVSPGRWVFLPCGPWVKLWFVRGRGLSVGIRVVALWLGS